MKAISRLYQLLSVTDQFLINVIYQFPVKFFKPWNDIITLLIVNKNYIVI